MMKVLAMCPLHFTPANTYLLWAPAVNDLLGVLGFLPILPCQVNNKSSVLLILAHVYRLDIIVPAAAWGFPFGLLGAGGRCRVFGMAVLARALGLGGGGWCRRLGLAATLSTLERVVGLLEDLLSASDHPKIL